MAKKKTTQAAAKTKKSTPKTAKTKVTIRKQSVTAGSLKLWNKWLTVLYAAQGIAIVIIGVAYTAPVTTSFLTKDTLASKAGEDPVLAPAIRHLFDVNILYVLAATLLIAAITHLLLATVLHNRYEKELSAGVNRVRWAGYGVVTASVMTIIGLLVGVYDASLLGALIILVLLASLSGLAVEVYSQGKTRRRLAAVIGSIAAVTPWLVFGGFITGANVYGSGNIPAYVYGVVFSVFVLFAAFMIAQLCRYKKVGQWADYRYAERMYSVIIFVTLTALTWQLYAGILRP